MNVHEVHEPGNGSRYELSLFSTDVGAGWGGASGPTLVWHNAQSFLRTGRARIGGLSCRLPPPGTMLRFPYLTAYGGFGTVNQVDGRAVLAWLHTHGWDP